MGQRIGKFEECDGGTLFLDEVGDMPLLMQSKVLRAIQEKEFQRVGGNQTIKSDAGSWLRPIAISTPWSPAANSARLIVPLEWIQHSFAAVARSTRGYSAIG